MTQLSEEQIRPQQMMADKQKYVDADREYLLTRKHRWVQVNCPACDANVPFPYGEKQGFTYVRCGECDTVYTNPRPSLELMHEFYAQSQNYAYWNAHIFPATEDMRRERIFRPRAQRLADFCRTYNMSGGTLLEIGAAFGTFCTAVRDLNLFTRIIALEPTPDLAQTCRERGLETLETFVENVQETAFADVICAFEVLEHLFSPYDFVCQCARLLKPTGLLVMSFPNAKGFDTMTLKMRSNTYDHEHVNYLHPQSVPRLLERGGFEVLTIETPGKLDAELVRKHALTGAYDLTQQPLLQEVLVNRWEELGETFQEFLANNRLSSHMWVVGRKHEGYSG
jgi:2-polyprenyl-3-methyl-5-hydroxy-6-metoxy-1,4-benzoquinol methylase